eukprot:14454601-Alexandrium_andersonii.AAC.1
MIARVNLRRHEARYSERTCFRTSAWGAAKPRPDSPSWNSRPKDGASKKALLGGVQSASLEVWPHPRASLCMRARVHA